MSQIGRRKLLIVMAIGVLLLVLLGLATSSMVAQTGGEYDLTWWTVDGGGGRSSGGEYTLWSTAGQADAGAQSGGEYTLSGGFWAGAAKQEHATYVPVVFGNQ